MEGIELSCFQIISAVGTARSMYIEAIQLAKDNKFDEARKLVSEGEETFIDGHRLHAQLIQQEANGELERISLILLHAEDQLMSAEGFKILADEFIDLYEKVSG